MRGLRLVVPDDQPVRFSWNSLPSDESQAEILGMVLMMAWPLGSDGTNMRITIHEGAFVQEYVRGFSRPLEGLRCEALLDSRLLVDAFLAEVAGARGVSLVFAWNERLWELEFDDPNAASLQEAVDRAAQSLRFEPADPSPRRGHG